MADATKADSSNEDDKQKNKTQFLPGRIVMCKHSFSTGFKTLVQTARH